MGQHHTSIHLRLAHGLLCSVTLTHVVFGPLALHRRNLPIMAARFSTVRTTVIEATLAFHWVQYALYTADQHVMLDVALVIVVLRPAGTCASAPKRATRLLSD